MTQQTINIGTTENDGTGDPARTAFGKVKVLDDVVNELYGELTEDDVPAAVQAKAAKLVKPFVAQKDKKLAIPPPAAVDWAALERDATRVRQLIALWRKQEEDVEIEEEDEYLLLIG